MAKLCNIDYFRERAVIGTQKYFGWLQLLSIIPLNSPNDYLIHIWGNHNTFNIKQANLSQIK